MNSRPLLILATAALVIAGIAIAYINMQPTPLKPAVATVATPAAPARTPEPEPPQDAASGKTAIVDIPGPAKATPAPAAIPEWDAKIDQVLRMNAGDSETAQMLINMLPSLPPDGQAEAAQHISNLISDKDYNRVLPLLKNASLPEQVQDVLVTDLMNRDDSVKLPALLDVAKIATHPYHEEALTDLQIFLDADNGQDWGKWQGAVTQYLQKQAAANAQ